MPFLNTFFGKYATLPMGWFFMVILVAIEIVVMSQALKRTYFNGRVAGTALLSNTISGLAGAFASKAINGGLILVVWLPWVSSYEVDISGDDGLIILILYYAVAFVATVLIELLVNSIVLKKRHGFGEVLRATVIANVVSYLLGTFVLYTYSFVFFD